jgi:hypothetical protein
MLMHAKSIAGVVSFSVLRSLYWKILPFCNCVSSRNQRLLRIEQAAEQAEGGVGNNRRSRSRRRRSNNNRRRTRRRRRSRRSRRRTRRSSSSSSRL